MSSLREYSSIAAKIKAMKSSLLDEQDFKKLSSSANIQEAVHYLKQHPGYNSLFSSIDETMIHRIEIEKLLTKTILTDYIKLYRFSNIKQRSYLKLHIKKYEIHMLKTCLRMVFDQKRKNSEKQLYKDFYDNYSQLNIELLFSSQTIQDLVSNLKGTEYYLPLNMLAKIDNPRLFDYEMTLDLYYFKTLWKYKEKYLSNQDLKMFTEDIGSNIDMLNIQWIYRSKMYYNMSNTDIYTLLIPFHYKLKKKDIQALAESLDKEDFIKNLKNTYYARLYPDLTASTLETFYVLIRNKILKRHIMKFPYSIAAINTYLYKKEKEIDKLTTVLECIRYHVEPSKTLEYISEPKNSG